MGVGATGTRGAYRYGALPNRSMVRRMTLREASFWITGLNGGGADYFPKWRLK